VYPRLNLLVVLIRNDFRLFLADRRAALLCFLVPIVLASVFTSIFERPGRPTQSARLDLLVVAEDTDPLCAGIIDDLIATDRADVRRATRAEAEAEIAKRGSGVAVVFPVGFSAACRARDSQKPGLELLFHPASPIESQWAEGLLTELVMKKLAKQWLEPMGLAGGALLERPFDMQHHSVPERIGHPFNSASHAFAGMTLQYLLFWGMESGLVFLRERQRGIWKRLRTSPVLLRDILLARSISTATIAVVQVLVTFSFGMLFFDVRITGSFAGFVLLVLAICLLSSATGLMVAAFGETEARARNISILVILAVSMIGGLWLPAFLLPRWIQDVSLLMPVSWAMRALDGVTWQGRGLASMLPAVAMVLVFVATFLVLAAGRFYWSESRRRRGIRIC